MVILLRKNAKDMKDGGRFPKRLSLQCVSLLVGSVGVRFRTQLQLTKTNYVLWSVLVFFFHIPACFRLNYIVGKKCGCWLLVSLTKCECCSSLKEEIVTFSKKKKTISKSSDKTSSTRGSSDAMFLVDMTCAQTPAHWHSKIPIEWYGLIYFVSLVAKKYSSICPEKTTENSIQMVNAPICLLSSENNRAVTVVSCRQVFHAISSIYILLAFLQEST